MQAKELPHNIDSEKIVLASIMGNINAYAEVSKVLTPDMFYDPFHKELYQLIVDNESKGKGSDMVVLSQNFSRDEAFRILEIANMHSWEYIVHAYNVQDRAIRRSLWQHSRQLEMDIYDNTNDISEIISSLGKELSNLLISQEGERIATMQDALQGVYEQIDRNLKQESRLTGSDTGFERLNRITGGLQKSDLIIVAGETSNGKTSFALALTDSAAKNGDSVAIYSLEMKKEQLASRFIAMNSNVGSKDILFSRLDNNRLEIVDRTIGKLLNRPIYFDDKSTSSIGNIIGSIRTMKMKFGISGAVVDYLQIIKRPSGISEETHLANITRDLKDLAKELDIWIIVVSQLNRDKLNPIPSLSRLRGSGQIEEAADIVMFVYRAEKYGKDYPEPFSQFATEGTAMIDIAKGRNVGLGSFLVGFDAEATRFYDKENLENKQKTEEEDPF